MTAQEQRALARLVACVCVCVRVCVCVCGVNAGSGRREVREVLEVVDCDAA